MPSAVIWIALALSLLMIAGALVIWIRAGLKVTRRASTLQETLEARRSELDATIARINERAPTLQRSADRLSASQARLSGALEALAVTRRAAGEARSPLRWYQSLLRP